MKSFTVNVKEGNTEFRIKTNEATGTYILRATFNCNNAPWTLVLDEPYSGTANPGCSGMVSSAPNGVCTIKLVKVN